MPVYKDEKRGTWRAVYRYTDWTGKRIETQKRGFATKREAKEYEAELIRTVNRAPDMTMESLCKLYLDDLRTRRKPSTVYTEEYIIRRHITPYLGNHPIGKITVAIVREWQNKIMQLEARNSTKPLSPYTLRNINVCLSSIFNYAVRFHGLPQNPVHVTQKMGKVVVRLDFWEEDEYKKFMSVIEDEDDRLYFSVLFTSGMRVGEFLALAPGDIDFKANTISITKTYNWKQKCISSPKTEPSIRTIAMPQKIIDEIRAYLSKRYEPPERIFGGVSQRGLTSRMIKYAERAGVKKIRLHDLRHSHASYLIHHGVPITAISQRLGHKNPKITLEVYSHVYKASDSEIVKTLELL